MDYQDPEPSVAINITINPSLDQISGFRYLTPPAEWDPTYIDCENLDIIIERPLNAFVSPYERLRSYRRNDIEYLNEAGEPLLF